MQTLYEPIITWNGQIYILVQVPTGDHILVHPVCDHTVICTSTAPIWDHISRLMWKPWLSYCWCLFCHMLTRHKTQDTSSLLTVLYHWRELPQVIFVVTKVLSWQRQKTCFVATKLFVVTKIILVAAPTKNCFVVSNGVCMRVCGERLLREKNGGGGGW